VRGKERALSMRSSTHLELELQSNLPCTYESVSGDINVLFLLLVSSNKGFAVRRHFLFEMCRRSHG
jgi:hypothetical protein